MSGAADAESPIDFVHILPRRETFLARYPRNFKLAVAALIFAATVLPWALPRLLGHRTQEAETQNAASNIEHVALTVHASSVPKLKEPPLSPEAAAALPALNDQDDRGVKLVPAPAAALTEDTAQGSLPRVAEDGQQPWQVYARPFDRADKRPRIAIVLLELGLSNIISDAAITRLPPTVTLVFSALSPVAGAWCTRARQDGHEVLISLPMEPFDYPRSDPGPNALLTSLPNSENIARLLAALRQGNGYVGVTTVSGSRFTTTPDKLRPVLEILKQRGLMILDSATAPHSTVADIAATMHLPAATQTVRLDDDSAPESLDAALGHLEQQARVDGQAVGVAAVPTPLLIERLRVWSKDLPQRGLALAPLSAMAQ